MAKKDERNLNITINNSEKEEAEVVVSISTILKKLKKYLAIWIVAAVVFVGAAFGYAAITTHTKKAELTALINFSYDGIEKGLDPNGRSFDVNTVKSPAVIETALTDLGFDLSELEQIRSGITFRSTIPKNAVDRFTVYNSILEQGGGNSLTAAERILETTYFPTQYTVYFDYNGTSFTDNEAVNIFNKILDCYKDYFYISYGYNESLGDAISAISYEDYDYAEAIDVFSNSLVTLRKYVKDLDDEDDSRFRSTITGYTFSDLYESIRTMETIDLDKLSSYVTVNNLTKDKESSLAYYEYRIKALTRQKSQLEEQLSAYEDSIKNYEKDQIIVFGSNDDANTQSSVASKQYDQMFSEKNSIASQLAETKQQINFYKERQQAIKGNNTGSKEMLERADADFAALNEKVNNFVELVSDTSEDYYKNITFANAYNVIVPASYTSSDRIGRIIDNAKMPAVALELVAFALYFAVAFIEALVYDSRKRKAAMESAKSGESGDGGDDDKDDKNNSEEKKDSGK
ncbi:MAG: lipopolysaccharide biosynthesis protein [Ruminococcus sp.]|nr:lipopolysaccharide biosynthesis protein [Ruminococcus sp.]MDE6784050.1 lipopolysaccharide biosynthesis protein [Ruminococcus sp.]